MTSSFSGKVYLITGAASGMGLAASLTLLSKGASVSLTDINSSALSSVFDSLPPTQKDQAITQILDVTSRTSVRDAIQQTISRFGHLDGIANFAGTGGTTLGKEAIWQTTDEEFDFISNVNIKGTFYILAEALRPGLLPHGSSIVHIASMYSLQGFKNGAVFAASKHAALGLVRSAAKESGERVRVNCVLPGPIDTPMRRRYMDENEEKENEGHNMGTVIERDGTVQEVADVVCFLLGRESGYVTGAAWSVDGGAGA